MVFWQIQAAISQKIKARKQKVLKPDSEFDVKTKILFIRSIIINSLLDSLQYSFGFKYVWKRIFHFGNIVKKTWKAISLNLTATHFENR